VRELREAAQYPPSRDRYRVFILDEAHQLSQSAWNGLLKILEEPPPWCVFVLCTTEPHKIPATIESRALHFPFRCPPPAVLARHLGEVAQREGLKVEPEAIELLVRAADGSVRDGLSALDQVRALAGDEIAAESVRQALGIVPGEAVAEYVASVLRGDAAAALAVVAALDGEGQDLRAFAGEALERVRRLALAKAGAGDELPRADELRAAAGDAGFEQLVWLGRVLDDTEVRLRQSGAVRALLDLATVRMAQMAHLPELAALVDSLGGGEGPDTAAGGARGAVAPARATAPPRPARTSAPAQPPPGETEPAEPEAPPAPRRRDDVLGLIAEVVQETRPSLAAYLAVAEQVQVAPDGSLTISLPAAKARWKDPLTQPAAKDALREAARRVLGTEPPAVHVTVGESEAPAPPRPTRDQALARARQDPLVREIFDRFGAVVVDGQALEP